MAKNSEVEATEDWDGTYKDELEWSLTKMTLFNKNIGRHLEMERELNADQIRWVVAGSCAQSSRPKVPVVEISPIQLSCRVFKSHLGSRGYHNAGFHMGLPVENIGVEFQRSTVVVFKVDVSSKPSSCMIWGLGLWLCEPRVPTLTDSTRGRWIRALPVDCEICEGTGSSAGNYRVTVMLMLLLYNTVWPCRR